MNFICAERSLMSFAGITAVQISLAAVRLLNQLILYHILMDSDKAMRSEAELDHGCLYFRSGYFLNFVISDFYISHSDLHDDV